jgi:hypothetical protein
MKPHLLLFAVLFCAASLPAQVPNLLSQQGRVAVNGVAFAGTGQFKFALVNAAGTVTYWSNDGTSTAGSQPAAAVPLSVTNGLYTVLLGDVALPGMTAVPTTVFANADLRLRVWFNDGALGFQQLTPDQRLAPNGYLPDGVVTAAKLAPGAVSQLSASDGSPPAALQVDANGNITFSGSLSGNGTGLTNLSAASLTGTVPAAQLPADVARRSGGNAFTGNQTITGNFGVTGSATIGTGFNASNAGSVAMGNNAIATGSVAMAFGNAVTASAANSMALGSSSNATHNGSFVWADPGPAFGSTAANQFLIRAAGGVGIGTPAPGRALQVGDVSTLGSEGMMRFASRGWGNTAEYLRYWDVGVPTSATEVAAGPFSFVVDDPQLGDNPELMVLWNNGYVGMGVPNPLANLHLYSHDPTVVFRMQSTAAPGFARLEFVSNPQGDVNEWRPGFIQSADAGGFTGALRFVVNGTGFANRFGGLETMRIVNGRVGIRTATPQSELEVNGTLLATTVVQTSDRNMKENFTSVDAREMLKKVAALPVTRWNFKGESHVEHIGPMAQDFHAAFATGADDRHIATVDAGGVALAAIKGLNEKLTEKEAELTKLRSETDALRDKNDDMEQRLAALEEMLRRSKPVDFQ